MSRIVLLPSAYLPDLGGVEELTRHLALALTTAGETVEVWTQQSDLVRHPSVEELDGLTVRRFPFPLPSAHPTSLARIAREGLPTIRAMAAAVRQFRPDVLHVQCFGPNGVYATVLSYLRHIPLIVTLQGETVMDDADIYSVSSTLRSALRLGLRRAAEVTGCSAYTLADSEARFGLQRGRGVVIFNGVALEDIPAQAGDPPPAPPYDGRYVLALGRVVEKKGFDLLIRSFAEVCTRHPDVDLIIAGTGRAQADLRRLISDLGLSGRVNLVGRLTRAEVASALVAAEVFVMPSRLEPFGIVVLEAWRAARPVIATSRGGPTEFVHDGQDGILVDPLDGPALAAALDRVLSEEAVRTMLGTAGRHRVPEFDWPVIADQYRRLYSKVGAA